MQRGGILKGSFRECCNYDQRAITRESLFRPQSIKNIPIYQSFIGEKTIVFRKRRVVEKYVNGKKRSRKYFIF